MKVSAEKTVTERDCVLREREAFKAGARAWERHRSSGWAGYDAEAARHYPLPRQFRIVKIGGLDYRFVDGRFEYRDPNGQGWVPSENGLNHPGVTQDLDKYVDLMNNPMEGDVRDAN